MDYKGQEPSNLVFSEFRRSLLCSKTFFISKSATAGFVCESLIYRRFLTFIFLSCILSVVFLSSTFVARKSSHNNLLLTGLSAVSLTLSVFFRHYHCTDNVRDVCFSVA